MYDSCWTAMGWLFLVSNWPEWVEKWQRETRDKFGRVTSMNFVWDYTTTSTTSKMELEVCKWCERESPKAFSLPSFWVFFHTKMGIELNFHFYFSPAEWDGLFWLLGGFIDWMMRKSPFIPFLLQIWETTTLIYVSLSAQLTLMFMVFQLLI